MLKKIILLLATFGVVAVSALESPMIIGYFPYWAQYSQIFPKDIRYDFVTHIHYGILVADESGNLGLADASDEQNFSALIKNAKERNVKILATVGGADNAAVLQTLGGSESGISSLVKGIMSTVKTYGLDGIELDWIPADTDKGAYGNLIKALAQAFSEESPKLTLAATLTWDESKTAGYDTDALLSADYLTVQSIDLMDTEKSELRPNADIQVTKTALALWEGKGFKASKLVPVTPFYGKSFSGAKGLGSTYTGVGSGNEGFLTYRELMTKFEENTYKVHLDEASQSEVAVSNEEAIVFNGIPSTKALATLVKDGGYAGIAASDISCDHPHWKVSLLVTLGAVLRPEVNYKAKKR